MAMGTLYMLDTDMSSYLIKGTSPPLDARLQTLRPEQTCISAITRAELLFGVRRKVGAYRLSRLVDQFLFRIKSLPWDDAAADHFAAIAAELLSAGTPIGSMDAMIAGHARSVGAVLVTNNTRHHSRVSGLVIENWTGGN
jgi:tRNA(fMet)-specific endonuclease VapC